MSNAADNSYTGGVVRASIDEEKTALAKARFDRHSESYDRAMAHMDRFMFGNRRRLLWALADGKRILEVGAGTGANFPYYPVSAETTAIDLSDKMLEKAKEKARRDSIKVDLQVMDVQRLDFPDDYFDCVVATCVFCSVTDPVLGLSEVARVCKPDGKVLLLEHMRSETPLGYLMDLANPLIVRMGGPSINRRTLDNIRRAGMIVERADPSLVDIVRLIVARPLRGTVPA